MTADPRRAAFRARVLAAVRLQAARTVALAASDDDRDIVEGVIGRGQEKFAAIALALLAGEISRSEFLDQAQTILSKAAASGAKLGGVGSKDAAGIADDLIAKKQEHLDDLADELDEADLESGPSEAQIGARAMSWLGVAFTAMQVAKGQDAKGDGDGSNVSITWVLDPGAEHCDDCPDMAEGSPYTFDTLPTYPGEDVECGGRCRCELEYEATDGGSEGGDEE